MINCLAHTKTQAHKSTKAQKHKSTKSHSYTVTNGARRMLQKENDGKGKKDVPVMSFDHHRDLNSVLDKTAQGKGMPTKRYAVNLSVEMHNAFKLACLKEGVSMKDVGVELIAEWLKARADK